MTKIVFEEVSQRSRWRFRCAGCRKLLVRSRKFWQTLNQFNVHKNGPLKGQVKDRSAVYAELRIEVNKWQASDQFCSNCEKE